MADKQNLKDKLAVVFAALQKPAHWYTGLSIKRYLKQNIFSLLKDEFNNSSITSGRWSAYCHYSEIKAFVNLLDKNEVKFGSNVLVHPLLPDFLIDELIKKEANIITLDVNKSTLNFDPKEVESVILTRLNSEKQLDLVVHYGFNGLYENIIESIKIAQEAVVPSLVVIDNYDTNLSLMDLFNTLTLGSVLWSFGDSFLDDQLDSVMDITLQSQPWFISWHLETRTRAILEYHLSQSHDLFEPIIGAFFYLLLDAYKKVDFFGNVYKFAASKVIFKDKFKKPDEALNYIKLNYDKLYESAIPDLVFDLQGKSPERNVDFGLPEFLLNKSGQLQYRAKQLYDFFLEGLNSRESGSLEIPDYYLDKSYLKYFVYTTEADHWYNELKKQSFIVETLPPMHRLLVDNPNLKNAQFATKFGILIDVTSGLEK
ncbi:MAG: hypothetical protein WCK98_05190 [bacterium]